MTNQPGKRYKCQNCGTEVLCVTGGDGKFECCGAPIGEFELEPLPAGD